MTTPRFSSILATLSAAVVLSGCAGDINQRGNLPPPDDLAQIHPGKTTKDEVAKILGTPSSVGVFDDNDWYYISRRTKQVAFFDPDVLDQQVYIVDFNPDGVVQAVEHKTLRNGQDITPVARTTPAPGKHLTFIEQIIGNLGKFNGNGGGGEGVSAGGPSGAGPSGAGPSTRSPGPNPYSDE
jgi:outer membrane protein assembly factor BamE (lipoprotein component of BamABCDE complex)